MRLLPRRAGLAALVAALSFAATATVNAGFIPGSVRLGFSPPGPPPWAGQGGPPPFVFDLVPGNSALGKMQIDEDILGADPLNLRISGNTTSDPIIEIIKTVTNNSGNAWVGYDIGLTGGSNSFVSGTASSDKMTLLSQTANMLTFGLPSPVPSGQSVTFDFKINIPDTGPFQFDLSQQAVVPEPDAGLLAAVACGVGALFAVSSRALRRRKAGSLTA